MKKFKPLVLALALTMAFATALPAPAAETEPVPDPDLPPERVVEIQLNALQHNDVPRPDAGIARTWAFAHPANKSMTGPLERFEKMLKGPAYRLLLNHRSHAIRPVSRDGDAAVFVVTVVPESGPVVFYQWQVGRVETGEHEGAWMTMAVSPPIERGDTI